MLLNIGTLFGYIAFYIFFKIEVGLAYWIMLVTTAITLALLIIVVVFLPESPRWLIIQGRLGDTKRVVAGISDSEEEAMILIAEIKQAANIPQEFDRDIVQVNREGRWLDLFRSKSIRQMLYLSVGMYLVQQLSGGDMLFLYRPKIFDIVTSSHNLKLLLAMGVDIVKTICLIIPILLLDRVGRRRLLLFSMGGLIISLVSFGTCLIVIERVNLDVPWVICTCIVSLLFYAGFFSIGIGAITGVYSSEIFSLRLRTHGCAIGITVS